MRRLMNVNINFYGHAVDIDPEDIAEELGPDATEDDIEQAVQAAVASALEEDVYPSYASDHEDVVERVKELLAERDEDDNG